MQENEVVIISIWIEKKQKWAIIIEKQDTFKLEQNWNEIKKDIIT